MSRKYSFVIEKNGNVRVADVVGMGANCQQATEDTEKLLGKVDESSRSMTENYFVEVDPLVLKNSAG